MIQGIKTIHVTMTSRTMLVGNQSDIYFEVMLDLLKPEDWIKCGKVNLAHGFANHTYPKSQSLGERKSNEGIPMKDIP